MDVVCAAPLFRQEMRGIDVCAEHVLPIDRIQRIKQHKADLPAAALPALGPGEGGDAPVIKRAQADVLHMRGADGKQVQFVRACSPGTGRYASLRCAGG